MGPIGKETTMPRVGQLVRKDNPEIDNLAVVDVIPGHCRILDASLTAEGAIELDYDGTAVMWNGQRNALGPHGRFFVDANDEVVSESEVVLHGDDGELYPPKLPLAGELKPACSMMEALGQAVAGRRVRRREWHGDVFLHFSPTTGFALGRFSDPAFVEPYRPARLDVDAAPWMIVSGGELTHGA
jgi:hypothetical protein